MDSRLFGKIIRRMSGRAPKQYGGDEGAEWMGWTVTGMFTMQDVYAIDAAIQRLPSGNPLIEIGSFCGRSTCFLLHLLKRHQRPNALFCSDKWLFEGYQEGAAVPGTRLSFPAYREHVKNLFATSLKAWHADRLPHSIEAGSQEFFAAWQQNAEASDVFGRRCQLGGPVSFALIDGEHTYEQTKADFEAVDRFLEPQGLIFMHDTCEPKFGCRRALREILRTGRYRLVMENPNALIQKSRL